MKTRRKVDALIKHLGLRYSDKGTYMGIAVGRYTGPEVTCPNENGITNRVEALEHDMKLKAGPFQETVECKTCHCLLKKESAIKGEKRIETQPITNYLYVTTWGFEDTIVQDYFCGRCAPKGGKK